MSKVLNSIEKKKSSEEDKRLIYGIENLRVSDILSNVKIAKEEEQEYNSNAEEENLSWEEDLKKMAENYSNEYTDELEFVIYDLEEYAKELKKENKKLKRKQSKEESEQQKRKIEELQNENSEQKKKIEELLAYKKFFDEMKLKMSEFSS